MTTERTLANLNDSEVCQILIEEWSYRRLSRETYDAVMGELERRNHNPSSLATLALLGQPEWYEGKFAPLETRKPQK